MGSILNDSIAKKLRTNKLGDNLLLHTVDLVADNGDRAYGAVADLVFILTCDEYRKYRDYIQHSTAGFGLLRRGGAVTRIPPLAPRATFAV